ncbi:MAG: right-handed parallel beta-helix repeat-containing protein, partial [Hyphomicrobiaceae bacterium]
GEARLDETGPRSIGGDGISFNKYNADVTIRDVAIANVAGHGIGFMSWNQDIVIEGRQEAHTKITDVGQNGIKYHNWNTDVTIRYVDILKSGKAGIRLGSNNGGGGDNPDLNINHVSINDALDNGVEMWANNTMEISDSTIQGTAADVISHGVYLIDDGNTVTLRNTTITNITYGNGLSMLSYDNAVRIYESEFSNIGHETFHFAGTATLLVQGTTFGPNLERGPNEVTFLFDESIEILEGSDNNRVVPDGIEYHCGRINNSVVITGSIQFTNHNAIDANSCPVD